MERLLLYFRMKIREDAAPRREPQKTGPGRLEKTGWKGAEEMDKEKDKQTELRLIEVRETLVEDELPRLAIPWALPARRRDDEFGDDEFDTQRGPGLFLVPAKKKPVVH